MIEDPPLLTISRKFERPEAQAVNMLSQASTGVVVDCIGGAGAIPVKSVNPAAMRFAGSVITCDCGPADNLAVFAALKLAEPGDVIVIATNAYKKTAVIGDMVLGMAKNCGVVAMVTDGYVRDLDGICEVGLPCFAEGVTPNSPARQGPGTAGLPVVLDGVLINSGDIMVGDRDGVVVVPKDLVGEVLVKLPEVLKAEAEMEVKVRSGLKLPEFVSEFFEGDGVRFVD